MLLNWSDDNPNSIYGKLKKMSHYYTFNERTLGDLTKENKEKGLARI